MSTKSAPSKEMYLGTISTEIVGIQYYDAEVRPGEEVHFEREPDNPHDRNAIRVENLDFEQVGNLPRQLVAWLAPLIASGKLRIDGSISSSYSSESAEHKYSVPLRLNLYLCPKGKTVLRENTAPRNDLEALHDVIRKAYVDADTYADPDVIYTLGERLTVMLKRDVLPETHLLVNLFPTKAEMLRKRRITSSENGIRNHLASVTIGMPVYHRNLTMYPLTGGNGRKSPFTLLDTAIKRKVADVHEVSDEGSVPYVELTNSGSKPILLVEGEIMIGAKQNRTINISIVAAAEATTRIPVSCVERGRWNYVSKRFDTGFHAPPSLRSINTQTVRENRRRTGEYTSDQSAVWETIDGLFHDLGVTSETSDVTAIYKQQEKRLRDYRKNIRLPSEARGVIFVSGGKVLGMDLFDTYATLKKYWKKLSGAYFVEASRGKEEIPSTDAAVIDGFLDQVKAGIALAVDQPGDGIVFDVEAKTIAGSGVRYGDRVCHLSAFSIH